MANGDRATDQEMVEMGIAETLKELLEIALDDGNHLTISTHSGDWVKYPGGKEWTFTWTIDPEDR